MNASGLIFLLRYTRNSCLCGLRGAMCGGAHSCCGGGLRGTGGGVAKLTRRAKSPASAHLEHFESYHSGKVACSESVQ